jgi:hypothetical protein
MGEKQASEAVAQNMNFNLATLVAPEVAPSFTDVAATTDQMFLETNTVILPEWPLVGYPVHPMDQTIFVITGSAMVCSGIVGNLLILSVNYKQIVRKRSAHHLFIGNLALADLVAIGYWFPFFVLDLALGFHPVANRTHCAVNGLITSIAMTVSYFC